MTHLLRELSRGKHGDVVPAHLQSWQVGAVGELLVGAELARLPEGWRVLHSIPVGQEADVDHLVVGPPGVFVLNTKRHPAKAVTVGTHAVWINGVQQNGYQRSLIERSVKVSAALGRNQELDLVVQPLLVFVEARELRRSGAQTVESVRMAGLLDHMVQHPPRLHAAEVEEIFHAASQPQTWGRAATVLLEPDPTAAFLDLRFAEPALPARPISTESVPARGSHRIRVRVRPPRRGRGRALEGLLRRLLLGLSVAAGIMIGSRIFAEVVQAFLFR